MFAGNVTVPIIIAGAASLAVEDKVFLIQMAMFTAGIATLIQTVGLGPIGARLPIVQGTSFAFIQIMIPIVKGASLATLFGAVLISGLLVFDEIWITIAAGVGFPLVAPFLFHQT